MTITIPSYTFDTSDKMKVNNIAVNKELNSKTTVEFFMQWDGKSSCMPFGWDTGYDLWLNSGFFGFNTGQGEVLGIESSSLVNRWVHVSAVFNNGEVSSDTCKLYINGVLQNISLNEGSITPVEKYVSSTFFLSGWSDDANYAFSGKISNLRIWNEERTAEQVINTPFNLSQNTNPKLLGFWKLDGNMNDESMYNNNGEGLIPSKFSHDTVDSIYLKDVINGRNVGGIDTTIWERSSVENWESPTPNSLKMKVNLNHDYIVSDVKYANYTISSSITTLTGDDDGVGIVFDYIDSKNYKYIMYQGGGLSALLPSMYKDSSVTLVEVVNGIFNVLQKSTEIPNWNRNSTFKIKLDNIFGNIAFYVNDVLAIKYRKEDSTRGKIGFVTYSQIADFNDIKIEQSLTNRAVAKYKLYAVVDSDAIAEIEVKQYGDNDSFAEIYARALRQSEKETSLEVKYRGNNDVLTEIQPIGFFDTLTEIEVRPNNRMWAIYEIQRPPLIDNVTNPIMDAFTRSDGVYATVNNGSGTSMVVGKDESKVWDSYLKFDISHINPSLPITGSRLRLYYTGTFYNINIEVREVLGVWEEYSITYLNSPQIGRLISNSYVHDYKNKYIEIDVSDIVLEWLNSPHEDFGFYINASDISPVGNEFIFRTRESYTPPELIVTHYDTAIYSNGRSDIITEINAMKAGLSEFNTEVEVGSTFSFSIVDTMIYCRQLDTPVHDDIDVVIEATSPKLHAELTISIIDESDVNVEIDVYGVQTDNVDTEVTVNTPFNLVEIFSAYIDDKYTEIVATTNKVFVEITSVVSSNVDVEIDISKRRSNDIHVELTVNKSKEYVEIQPRLSRKSDLYTEITANQPMIWVEIRPFEQSNMDTEITVLSISSKPIEITVNKPKELVELYVRAYGESDVDSEVYVKHVSFVEVEITTRSTSQCEVEISAKITSNIEAEITVSRNREYVEISPRVSGDDDVLSELEPRISIVDNIPVVITVGGRRGAYGFVM